MKAVQPRKKRKSEPARQIRVDIKEEEEGQIDGYKQVITWPPPQKKQKTYNDRV